MNSFRQVPVIIAIISAFVIGGAAAGVAVTALNTNDTSDASMSSNDHSSMKHSGGHGSHGDMDHPHYMIPEGSENIPTIELSIEKDAKSGYNLDIDTTNFEFSRANVNQQVTTFNEGHAHLFINGSKVTRLYSNTYYLNDSDVEVGDIIAVHLNTNMHENLMYDGAEIFDQVMVN